MYDISASLFQAQQSAKAICQVYTTSKHASCNFYACNAASV